MKRMLLLHLLLGALLLALSFKGKLVFSSSPAVVELESIEQGLENTVYRGKYPGLVLFTIGPNFETAEAVASASKVLSEFEQSCQRMMDTMGAPFQCYVIKLLSDTKDKLIKEIKNLNLNNVPEIRAYVEHGMYNVYQKKMWRASKGFSHEVLSSASNMIRTALSLLPSNQITVIKNDAVSAFEDFLKIQNDKGLTSILIFTEKPTIAAITKALSASVEGRANCLQIVMADNQLNDEGIAKVVTGSKLESLPQIYIQSREGEYHKFSHSEPIVSKNVGLKRILEFVNDFLPVSKESGKKTNNDGDDQQEEQDPDIQVPGDKKKEGAETSTYTIIKNLEDFKTNVLYGKMPAVVAFRLTAPNSDAVSLPIKNWKAFDDTLKEVGMKSYIVQCDIATTPAQTGKKWWCPENLERLAKKYQSVPSKYAMRAYMYDEREYTERKEDPDEKRYLDVDSVAEARKEAQDSFPNLVLVMKDVKEVLTWGQQTAVVEKQLPVILVAKSPTIPLFLTAASNSMAGTAKFAYCGGCNPEDFVRAGFLSQGDVHLPIIFAIATKPDPKNPSQTQMMIARYDDALYGKTAFSSTLAWVLGLLRELDPEAYMKFVRGNSPSSSSSKTTNDSGSASTSSIVQIDPESPIKEIQSSIDWKSACGEGVKAANVICVLTFLNSAEYDVKSYIETLRLVRNDAHKRGLMSTIEFRFHWFDVSCQAEIGDKAFAVDPSNTPTVIAFHPAKVLRSKLIGAFTESSILSWLETVRNGRGFNVLPKIYSEKNKIEALVKDLDCNKIRDDLAKELQREDL